MLSNCVLWAFKKNYNTFEYFVNKRQFKLCPDNTVYPKMVQIGTRNFVCEPEKAKCSDNGYRHKYHEESENAVNKQILAELDACYSYLSMASYFGRSEVALPGCYAFFFQMHLEELEHAHKLIRYQIMRGGKVVLKALKGPDECTNWNIQQSFEQGLAMEKKVKDCLEEIVTIAEKHKDHALADFIIADYLQAQDKSIQEYSRLLQRYKSMTCGQHPCSCTDYLFDKELHCEFAKVTNEDEIKLTVNEKAYK